MPLAAHPCRTRCKGPSLSRSPPHLLPSCAPTTRELPGRTHSQLSPRHAPSATGPASASTPLENVGSAPPISALPAEPAPPLDVEWTVARVRSAWNRTYSSCPSLSSVLPVSCLLRNARCCAELVRNSTPSPLCITEEEVSRSLWSGEYTPPKSADSNSSAKQCALP